jgi:hypothetical protein
MTNLTISSFEELLDKITPVVYRNKPDKYFDYLPLEDPYDIGFEHGVNATIEIIRKALNKIRNEVQ